MIMQSSRAGQPGGRHAMHALINSVNSVYALLQIGLCALAGTAPLVLAMIFVHDVTYYPLYLATFFLSAPGFAAMFASFRDCPSLSSRNGQIRSNLIESVFDQGETLPDWIAKPFIEPDSNRIFIPFWRAYIHLAIRSWVTTLPLAFVCFCLLYDIQIVAAFKWSIFIVPPLVCCVVLLIQACFVALVLVVEYPKAKLWPTIRNAVLLSARRWYMLLVSVLAGAGYIWGLARFPILVALLATGLIGYIIWGSARWQANSFFVQMARESKDKHIIALYKPQEQGDVQGSSPLADFKQ